MKPSRMLIVLATILSCVTFLGSDKLALGMASRPPVIGSPAPEFQLSDLEGKTKSLSQYRGHVVLLNFWATWCKPCTKEMPAMQAAYDELKDQGLVVLAVNELEDLDRVREHISEHGHTFPVLLDHDNRIANMYGVVGLPVTVFIDETGRIQEYIRGGLLTTELIHQTVARLAMNAASHPLHPSDS